MIQPRAARRGGRKAADGGDQYRCSHSDPRKLILAEFAASAVMSRAALGAAPTKILGIHRTAGGFGIYGQPVVVRLDDAASELNEAGGLLARPVQLVNHDDQSNIQLHTWFATRAATRDEAAVMHAGITSAPERRSARCC